MARDDPEDAIPGNRCDFATTLARPAPAHARQPERFLKFELLGTDDEPLTYEEVSVALLELLTGHNMSREAYGRNKSRLRIMAVKLSRRRQNRNDIWI